MTFIDFILNLACLGLWLSWRSTSFDPLVKTSAASLVGALKRAEPRRVRKWQYLAALAGLLVVRALLYWGIGSAVNWVPNLRLGAIAIFFRSDLLGRMLLFSGLSFVVTLIVCYLWLLLFSLVNQRAANEDAVLRLVRLHLGWIELWPWALKLLLPLFVAATAWLAINPLLTRFSLVQPAISGAHRIEQAAVIGLGAYLAWKYLIGGVLFLWLLTTYVYLGGGAFWNFVSLTGRNLLLPLRWAPLRIGKVDFAPVVAIVVVFFASEQAERGLTLLYTRLPL